MSYELVLIAGAAGLFVFAYSVGNWRRAILMVMVLLVFEGALRKWMFPGAQKALYFAKDFILIGAYLGFASARIRAYETRDTRLLKMLCLLAAVYGAIQIFNPNSPAILLGLIGWKAYFLYIPLAFIVPHVFRSLADMDRALRIYLSIAIPVAALGVVQFSAGADSALNAGLGGQAIYFGGGSTAVRSSGTFSFISGFSEYLIVIVMLALGVLTAVRWRMFRNWIPYVALVASLAGMFSTGSRSTILSVLAMSPIFLWLSARGGNLAVATAVKLGFAMFAVMIAVSYLAPEAINAWTTRTEAAGLGEARGRVASPFLAPLNVLFAEGHVLGLGIGTTHNAAATIVGTTDKPWLQGVLLEGESGRVAAELGILGFLLIYGIRIYLLVLAVRYSVRLRSAYARALAAVLAPFFTLHILTGAIVNPTVAVYYWFAAGLLFALHRFDALSVRATPLPKNTRPAGVVAPSRLLRSP